MKSALLVIDAQQSFTRRPYWREDDVGSFLDNLQLLIDRAQQQGVPVLQVFPSRRVRTIRSRCTPAS